MIQKARFQDLMQQKSEDQSKHQTADENNEAMIRLFIEASTEEEIQKIERWLLR